MKLALGLLLLVFGACAASAQTPPPVKHVVLAPRAEQFLDSIALDARVHNVETAGCLLQYSVRESVLVVERFGPALYSSADSLDIYPDSTGPICPFGVPSVHAHLLPLAWEVPSPADSATARFRGIWNLLLRVYDNGWRVVAY